MAIQVSASLKEYSKRRAQQFLEWERTEPPVSTRQIRAGLVENVKSRAEATGLAWYCDGPSERGGTNAAPGPLQYFLSSMAFCQLTHYAENAATMDISLEEVSMTVKGYLNPKPGHAFHQIEFETQIKSGDSPSRIGELAKRAEYECYVTNTLKKACDVRGRVLLNGQPLEKYVNA